MVNVAFTDYSFKSLGASTNRTMPTRYNDIVNVKDFGAVGNGIANDSGAIKDAIDFAFMQFSQGRIVYFPRGTYNIGTTTLAASRPSAPLTGSAIVMMGAGRDATIIKGNVNGNLINAYNVQYICDMTIWNQNTTLGSCALFIDSTEKLCHVYNCKFIGMIGYWLGYDWGGGTGINVYMSTLRDCIASPPSGADISLMYANEDTNDGAIITSHPMSIGFAVATTGIINCHATGYDIGFAISGAFATSTPMVGCTAERCRIGIAFGFTGNTGQSPGASQGASEGHIFSNVFNRCLRAIYGYKPSLTIVAANVIKGETGPTNPAVITGITHNATTATATTAVPHGFTGTKTLVLTTSPAAWTPDGTGDQLVDCARQTDTTFSYALNASGGGSPTGTWNWPITLAIQVANSKVCSWIANVMSARAGWASFDTDLIADQPQNANIAIAMRGLYGWYLPTSATTYQTLGQWKFISCGTAIDPPTNALAAPVAFTKFSHLADAASEGNEFSVYDCQAQASFGGTVSAGGSSNRYKLRYDGTNWVRVA